MYDFNVVDMVELGIENFTSLSSFKVNFYDFFSAKKFQPKFQCAVMVVVCLYYPVGQLCSWFEAVSLVRRRPVRD